MKNELSKQETPSGPWGVHPSPKTDAEKRSENKEDAALVADNGMETHRGKN